MHQLQKLNMRQKKEIHELLKTFNFRFEFANEVNGDDLKWLLESSLKLCSILIQRNHL